MSVKIRLARGGAKKNPYYRIVVSDSRSPRDGRFIEKVGTYNPLLPSENLSRVILNKERIKYWISVGASPTDTVEKFLVKEGLITRTKMKQKIIDNNIKRTQDLKKKKEADAKAAAEAEAKAKSEAEAKPEAEAKS